MPTGGGTILNDASELSPTPVASHLSIAAETPQAAAERIRAALAEARAAGRPFVASTARHSMGGQSLAKNGTVVTLDQQWLEPDTAAKTYRVASGTRWSVVISKLDLGASTEHERLMSAVERRLDGAGERRMATIAEPEGVGEPDLVV